MSFEYQVKQLAQGASLKISNVDYKHATLLFDRARGGVQALWIIPYGDVWEFSVQSAVRYDNPQEFPQWLMAGLLTKNSKNKRAYWCIEILGGKHVLSAMLNFPASVLTSSEFASICRALVTEVEVLEQAIWDIARSK